MEIFIAATKTSQSSTAIKNLLDAGYSADRILYYRGGMHDWITLGLPVQRLQNKIFQVIKSLLKL